MQIELKDIYKELSNGDEGLEQFYKDFGTFVFSKAAETMKNCDKLIVSLRGVGRWYLRKNRMEVVVNEWKDRSEFPDRDEYGADSTFLKHLDLHSRYVKFFDRLKEYEVFVSKKLEARQKRAEIDAILGKPIIQDTEEKYKSE